MENRQAVRAIWGQVLCAVITLKGATEDFSESLKPEHKLSTQEDWYLLSGLAQSLEGSEYLMALDRREREYYSLHPCVGDGKDQVGHLWLNRVAFQAGASGMKRVSIIVLLTQSQQRLLLCAHNWYILKVRPKLKHKQASGKILGRSWTIPSSPFPFPTVEIQVCFICHITSLSPLPSHSYQEERGCKHWAVAINPCCSHTSRFPTDSRN